MAGGMCDWGCACLEGACMAGGTVPSRMVGKRAWASNWDAVLFLDYISHVYLDISCLNLCQDVIKLD